MISDAIRAIISNDATLSALLTTGSILKFFPVRTPQAQQLPFAIYRISSDAPSDTKQGASILDELALDISVFAGTYDVLTTIGAAFRTALDRYNAAATSIDKIIFENAVEGYDEAALCYNKEFTFRIRLKS